MARRSALKDALAGVDPTGTYTFRYGIDDAGKSAAHQKRRRRMGVAGGIVGGTLAVPSAISGAIGAGKAVMQAPKDGLRAAGRTIARDFKRPLMDPYRAFMANRSLKRSMAGKQPREKDIKRVLSFAQNVQKDLPKGMSLSGPLRRAGGDAHAAAVNLKSKATAAQEVARKASEAAEKVKARVQRSPSAQRVVDFAKKVKGNLPEGAKLPGPVQKAGQKAQEAMRKIKAQVEAARKAGQKANEVAGKVSAMPTTPRGAVQQFLNPRNASTIGKSSKAVSALLRRGLIPLGLAGALTGTSSYLQHKSGVDIGKKLTSKQRHLISQGK